MVIHKVMLPLVANGVLDVMRYGRYLVGQFC